MLGSVGITTNYISNYTFTDWSVDKPCSTKKYVEMEGIILEQCHSIPWALLRCSVKITLWATSNIIFNQLSVDNSLPQFCWKQGLETTWLAKEFVHLSFTSLIISTSIPMFESSLLTSCIIILITIFRLDEVCLSVRMGKKWLWKGKWESRRWAQSLALTEGEFSGRQISLQKVSKWM